jgi:hypothetical protein
MTWSSAATIYLMRDSLHMEGVYAFLIVAEMIYLLAFGNWAYKQLPRYQMRRHHYFGVGAIRISPLAYEYLTVALALCISYSRGRCSPKHTSGDRIRRTGLAQQSYHKWRRFVGVVSLWHEGNIA